jgi:hypothetical protein
MVLGMILSPLLHTALLLMLVAQTTLGLPLFGLPNGYWPTLNLAVLCAGSGSTIVLTLIGLHRQRRYRLFPLQLLLPLYWLLMAWATLRAMYELVDRPFHWTKTQHRARKAAPEPVVAMAGADGTTAEQDQRAAQ